MKPHRGGLVLTFGVLSLVCCALFGIPAWVMASRDLKQMDAGEMDPAGRGMTVGAKVCGALGFVLNGFVMLGLLATIMVPSLLSRFGRAQHRKAELDIAAIESALDTYAIENGGQYPESLEVLVTPDENGQTFLRGYTSLPLDPWRNPYVYVAASGEAPPHVISYGKDGQPGGQGDDADFGARD